MQKIAEWTLQAEFCRNMADFAQDTERKANWLLLAQRWLALGRGDFESAVESFSAAVQVIGTTQESSP